jgi:hypothetical protein
MIESVARVATGRPERYLRQLVDHLGHRLSTGHLEDGRGEIIRDRARCTLEAADGSLVLTATGEDAEALRRIQDVVARHLERFGGRESLQVQWSQPA